MTMAIRSKLSHNDCGAGHIAAADCIVLCSPNSCSFLLSSFSCAWICVTKPECICDQICEKGPHLAKLTIAVRSFVVGHVNLGRSSDFSMNRQYDALTNLWPSFTEMHWPKTEFRFRQTARDTYRQLRYRSRRWQYSNINYMVTQSSLVTVYLQDSYKYVFTYKLYEETETHTETLNLYAHYVKGVWCFSIIIIKVDRTRILCVISLQVCCVTSKFLDTYDDLCTIVGCC